MGLLEKGEMTMPFPLKKLRLELSVSSSPLSRQEKLGHLPFPLVLPASPH